MNRLLIELVIGVGFLCYTSADAAENGSSGGQLLKIGVGARPAAMGEAFCGVNGDVNNIYYNPAGLAQIRNAQFSVNHQEWLDDLRHESLSYVRPWFDGVAGMSMACLTMDELSGSNALGNTTGSFDANDMVAGVTYAKTLREHLAIGMGLKLLRQKIASENATAISGDMGAILRLSKSLSLGTTVQNLGTKVKFVNESDSLPIIFKIGGAYRTPGDRLLVAVDANQPVDDDLRVNIGAEYQFINNTFAIRGGYKSGIDQGGVTAGAGFHIRNCRLDYAFVPYGGLGNTHRISCSFGSFGTNQ